MGYTSEQVTKATQELNKLKANCRHIKQTTINQIQAIFKDLQKIYKKKKKKKFKSQISLLRNSGITKRGRTMVLVKIETFDHWIMASQETKEQPTAKMIIEREIEKCGHTFRTFKSAL